MGAALTDVSAPLTPALSAVAQLIARIQTEYVAMPGLSLSARQVERMWGVDSATCQAALNTLIDSRFLFRTPTGLFVLTPAAGARGGGSKDRILDLSAHATTDGGSPCSTIRASIKRSHRQARTGCVKRGPIFGRWS